MSRKKMILIGSGVFAAMLFSVGFSVVIAGNAVDAGMLTRSIDLCRDYMIRAQNEAGNFVYEYNWVTEKRPDADNSVRQAGALWALATYYTDSKDGRVAESIRSGLIFFINTSRFTAGGGRYVVYPGEAVGKLGTVALLTLTLVDYLRTAGKAEQDPLYRNALDGFVRFLLSARTASSLWYQKYTNEDGTLYGSHSPYFDGETLLALVKYAKYFNRADLSEELQACTDAAYDANVLRELGKRPVSGVLNGFYQWGTMACFELATSGWKNSERFARYVFTMADWKLDVDRIQLKSNGASSYEGLAHAYGMAAVLHDRDRLKRYGSVVKSGTAKLLRLQVGGLSPHPKIVEHGKPDDFAVGGVQNTPASHVIRIDIVQHQMSAFIFTRRFLR